MTRLLLAALAALLLAQDLSGPVVRVIDGDTIEIELAGETERVRYIGIDTPEMDDRRPGLRDLARSARRANERLVGDRRVRLELDVEKRDPYGRLLAYVWVGDTLVNEELVRLGHADTYTFPPNVRYVDRLVAAARGADRAPVAGARAVPPEGAIDASRASARAGEVATVCDRVASSDYYEEGRRRPTFLNLGDRPYPRQQFTVVIWGDHRDRFERAPESRYLRRDVCVRGTIELWRGLPQIVVEDPADLWVLE